MIRFYKTPWITRISYPKLTWQVSSDAIYLTFDDGPHPIATPWVLRELEKVNAKATFFCLGKNMEKYPQIIADIVNAGHQIGNHTYSHLNGWQTTAEEYIRDTKMCDEVMKKLAVETSLFRPPYGKIKRRQIKKLAHKKIIMWSHLSWDFDDHSNTKRAIQQLKKAKSGSILVFHDSTKSLENLKLILPKALSYFTSQGKKLESIKL